MLHEKKRKRKHKRSSSGARKRERTRIREVDFMRVEDTAQNRPLSRFELEIKGEIASGSSPLEDLIREEEMVSDREAKRVRKIKVSCLVNKARLTSKQRTYYRLLYVRKLTDTEVADAFLVSRVTVRRMRQVIKRALRKAFEDECRATELSKLSYRSSVTRRQHKVWQLRYKEGRSVGEIALKLGRSKSAVYRILKRVSKRIS